MKATLEVEMDTKGELMEKLRARNHPGDTEWVIIHMTHMYLAFCTPSARLLHAFCTPSDRSEEFLLSDNLFGIHEGPVSQKINLHTGEVTDGVYTEFHLLAAIAPRLYDGTSKHLPVVTRR